MSIDKQKTIVKNKLFRKFKGNVFFMQFLRDYLSSMAETLKDFNIDYVLGERFVSIIQNKRFVELLEEKIKRESDKKYKEFLISLLNYSSFWLSIYEPIFTIDACIEKTRYAFAKNLTNEELQRRTDAYGEHIKRVMSNSI